MGGRGNKRMKGEWRRKKKGLKWKKGDKMRNGRVKEGEKSEKKNE